MFRLATSPFFLFASRVTLEKNQRRFGRKTCLFKNRITKSSLSSFLKIFIFKLQLTCIIISVSGVQRSD